MNKRNYSVLNALKRGKGLGTASLYTPWHFVKDVPSKGFSNELYGIKTKRVHHFLSSPELECFLLSELNPNIVDIREQFPLLNIELIEKITTRLGVRHSYERYQRHTYPRIFTTDFLLTYQIGEHISYEAISVKKSIQDIATKRALELQEIERLYWYLQGIPWRLFIPDKNSAIIAQNIELLTSPIREPRINPTLTNSDIEVLASLHTGEFTVNRLLSSLKGRLCTSEDIGRIALGKLFFHRLISLDLTSSITKTKKLSIIDIHIEQGGYANESSA